MGIRFLYAGSQRFGAFRTPSDYDKALRRPISGSLIISRQVQRAPHAAVAFADLGAKLNRSEGHANCAAIRRLDRQVERPVMNIRLNR